MSDCREYDLRQNFTKRGGGGDFLPKLKCPEIIDDIPVIDFNWYYICAPPCNKGDFF